MKEPVNGVHDILKDAVMPQVPVQVMCVECQGTGKYWGNWTYTEYGPEPCPDCGGGGCRETPIPLQDFIDYVREEVEWWRVLAS
jgi:DnaJ-class molecular chaperone